MPQIFVGQRRGLAITQHCKRNSEKLRVFRTIIDQNGFADDFLLDHLTVGYGRINH